MCFLRYARDFGWLDPNIPTEEAKPLADTTPQKKTDSASFAVFKNRRWHLLPRLTLEFCGAAFQPPKRDSALDHLRAQ